jgi:hypothetical protein
MDQAEQNRTAKLASDEWLWLISFAPVLGDMSKMRLRRGERQNAKIAKGAS